LNVKLLVYFSLFCTNLIIYFVHELYRLVEDVFKGGALLVFKNPAQKVIKERNQAPQVPIDYLLQQVRAEAANEYKNSERLPPGVGAVPCK
jgi:hypothetical protein